MATNKIIDLQNGFNTAFINQTLQRCTKGT